MKRTSSILSVLLALVMIFSVTVSAAGGDSALTLVSAKVGDVDLGTASVPAGSDITLTFSNNVTDASVLADNIGKIKVKDSSGTATTAAVSPGTDKTVFIVALGDLAKGSYTLTIGQELKAKNGSTLGTKVEIAFTIKGSGTGDGTGGGGGNNPLSFVSATCDGVDLENAELKGSGKITITFDRGMTENQEANFKQIGIYDSEGNKVEGVTFTDFTKDENGNSYTVLSYKGLASGSYTLKLGKNLKANNGNTLGKAVNISFTVKADEGGSTNVLSKIIDIFMKVVKYIIKFFKGIIK